MLLVVMVVVVFVNCPVQSALFSVVGHLHLHGFYSRPDALPLHQRGSTSFVCVVKSMLFYNVSKVLCVVGHSAPQLVMMCNIVWCFCCICGDW